MVSIQTSGRVKSLSLPHWQIEMAKLFKPPAPITDWSQPSLFLAGTIDNGNSDDWQEIVEKALAGLDISILNPRRDAWDPTWEQSKSNPLFREQVEWELNGLERADLILVNFLPDSLSPITLLELGLFAASGKLIVVCPDGFWRKGNIEVVSQRYSIPLFETLDEGLAELKNRLIQLKNKENRYEI